MEVKPFPAWSHSVEKCLKEYNVRLENGVSSEDVEEQRVRYGWNELRKEQGEPLWCLVLEQFDNVLVKILLPTAFISFVLAFFQGDENGHSGFEIYVEPIVIVLIRVLNGIVGVWQEGNAEKALEALKDMQLEFAKAQRDGYYVPDFPARELVPGDIVELRVGDKAPADMRIVVLKTSTLRVGDKAPEDMRITVLKRVKQSSLTGESIVLTALNASPTVGGGAKDVYGEDYATEEQLVTPWIVSVACRQWLLFAEGSHHTMRDHTITRDLPSNHFAEESHHTMRDHTITRGLPSLKSSEKTTTWAAF